MRITGGRLGGRPVRAPPGSVRPTTDRLREAIFSSLGARIVGARVLDLFAGSGVLGLEAWSRGAAAVWWVESSGRVFQQLKRNVIELCGGTGPDLRCIHCKVHAFLQTATGEGTGFNVILLDPPYDPSGRRPVDRAVLNGLRTGPVLAADGWIILEQSARQPAPGLEGWRVERDKRYGETRIFMLTRSGTP